MIQSICAPVCFEDFPLHIQSQRLFQIGLSAGVKAYCLLTQATAACAADELLNVLVIVVVCAVAVAVEVVALLVCPCFFERLRQKKI